MPLDKVIVLTVLAFIACGCRPITVKQAEEVLSDSVWVEAIDIEADFPAFTTERKTHYSGTRPAYFASTHTKWVVFDADGYVNLRDEPSVHSTIMTTIPNYTILSEMYTMNSKAGGWIVVYYFNPSANEAWYGYVHKSRLVEIPRNITDNEHYIKLARVVTLISTEQKKDFTLQVFFFKHRRYDDMKYHNASNGFVLDEEKNKTRPISLYGGDGFSHSINHKSAGYDVDENAPEIIQNYYKEDWGPGIFAFHEQDATDFIRTGIVISKAYYYCSNETTRINFVVKRDIVLH